MQHTLHIIQQKRFLHDSRLVTCYLGRQPEFSHAQQLQQINSQTVNLVPVFSLLFT